MATQYDRIQIELGELNAYRENFREIYSEMRELQAKRDTQDGRAYRYSPGEREQYTQQIQKLEEARQKNWSELQEKYAIYPGLTGGERFVTPGGFKGEHYGLMYEGTMNYHVDPNVMQRQSLPNAIRFREAELKTLEQQQARQSTLTPLRDTRDAILSRQGEPPPPPAQPPTLHPAEAVGHVRVAETPDSHYTKEQEQRQWSPSNVSPLKQTLDAVNPQRTPPQKEAAQPQAEPPAPSFKDRLTNLFTRTPEPPSQAPQVQEGRPLTYEHLFEQPAVGERQNLPSFDQWRQPQAQHAQQFQQQLDQYYENQPPTQPTPAPQQPGHLKDLYSKEQGQSGQQPASPQPPVAAGRPQQGQQLPYEQRYTRVSAQHAQQLQQIEQGVQRLQRNMETVPPEATPRKEFDIRATVGQRQAAEPPQHQLYGDAPSYQECPQDGRTIRYEDQYNVAEQRRSKEPPPQEQARSH